MTTQDLLQWCAILVLLVFVFGLTRQLGRFVVPRRDQTILDGPSVGKRFSVRGLTLHNETEISQTARAAGKPALVMLASAGCPSCDHLKKELARTDPTDLPFVPCALISNERSDVSPSRFKLQINDADLSISHGAGVFATPFLIFVDDSGFVVATDVGGDLDAISARLRANRNIQRGRDEKYDDQMATNGDTLAVVLSGHGEDRA